jgi:putative nucleotidyltransferase with HDIG domain
MKTMEQFHVSGKILDYNLADEMNHGIYVSNMAYLVARVMELPEDYCYQIAVAGFLHDIGKLRLSTDKENQFVVEQMRFVRMHADLGYEILKDRGFSDIVLDSIRYHHENYDGSGYPYNLEGEEIPLGARIIRVCDTFAALTVDRPYRKCFTMDTSMELMIEDIKHFDMQVFLAFQKVVHEVGIRYKTSIIKGE